MEKLDIKLDTFEGPLDLLLHLIEKNKFNIFDIPIVEITKQYLDYLDAMEEENMDKRYTPLCHRRIKRVFEPL